MTLYYAVATLSHLYPTVQFHFIYFTIWLYLSFYIHIFILSTVKCRSFVFINCKLILNLGCSWIWNSWASNT